MANLFPAFEDFDRPSRWPQFWRRTYLLTLPISFPLHCALGVVMFLSLCVAGVLFGAVCLAYSLWTGKDLT